MKVIGQSYSRMRSPFSPKLESTSNFGLSVYRQVAGMRIGRTREPLKHAVPGLFLSSSLSHGSLPRSPVHLYSENRPRITNVRSEAQIKIAKGKLAALRSTAPHPHWQQPCTENRTALCSSRCRSFSLSKLVLPRILSEPPEAKPPGPWMQF